MQGETKSENGATLPAFPDGMAALGRFWVVFVNSRKPSRGQVFPT
jgi:hypothetical protein